MFSLIEVVNNTKEQYFNNILQFMDDINGDSELFLEYKDIFLNVDNNFIVNYVNSCGVRLFLLNCIHSLNRIANAKSGIGLDYTKDDNLIKQLERIKLMMRVKYSGV